MNDASLQSDGLAAQLRSAHADNRHLQETIAALRNELEAAQDNKNASAEIVRAELGKEVVQLRATAVALREELERTRAEREAAVAQALGTANSEITHLKATITA